MPHILGAGTEAPLVCGRIYYVLCTDVLVAVGAVDVSTTIQVQHVELLVYWNKERHPVRARNVTECHLPWAPADSLVAGDSFLESTTTLLLL